MRIARRLTTKAELILARLRESKLPADKTRFCENSAHSAHFNDSLSRRLTTKAELILARLRQSNGCDKITIFAGADN